MSDSQPPSAPEAAPDSAGQAVLARKYRPQHFDQLIGQDALVRTLTNAIASGRLHHAYLLTGVRGTGKTTTARIIAKALNYRGPNGDSGPTTGRTNDDTVCRAIAQGRHVDVLELDAASHTGVDTMRDILDSARYRPVEARYKVYIVDEVHMLSKGAFNALLKTLEEPPDHLVFIFATTEVRKVPATVISRCLRFDLQRVPPATLAEHYANICRAEGVGYEAEALMQIARAADGSVRDGLSLLDQAIALAEGPIAEATVRDMLGLAERARLLALAEAIFAGQPGEALDVVGGLYRDGGDPLAICQDLLELCHQLSRIKIVGGEAAEEALGPAGAERGRALAGKLGLAALNRAWQMLLKGLQEIQQAPVPVQALEMVVIRLAHTADLPGPEEALRYLRGEGEIAPGQTPRFPAGAGASAQDSPAGSVDAPPSEPTGTDPAPEAAPAPEPPEADPPPPEGSRAGLPESFAQAVELCRDEGLLYGHLRSSVELVSYRPGRIELRQRPQAPGNLAQWLSRHLQDKTGQSWMVSLTDEAGEAPLAEQAKAAHEAEREALLADPNVRAVLDAFPGAKVTPISESNDGAGDS